MKKLFLSSLFLATAFQFISCTKMNCDSHDKKSDCDLIPAKIIRYDCDRVIFQLLTDEKIGDKSWTDSASGLTYQNVASCFNTCPISQITNGNMLTYVLERYRTNLIVIKKNRKMNINKEEITNIENKLSIGIKNNDIIFLDNILHKDLLFIAPNGKTITKQIDLESHRSGGMIVEKLIPTIEDIKIIGDTAVVILVYETKGSMLGNPIQGQFKYIRIWKLLGDELKVIGGSCFQLT